MRSCRPAWLEDVTHLFRGVHVGKSLLYRGARGWVDVGTVLYRELCPAGRPLAVLVAWDSALTTTVHLPPAGGQPDRQGQDGHQQHVQDWRCLHPQHP